MPFGLSVAPSHFQRFINAVLGKVLARDVILYLDDILISSYAVTEHENLVHEEVHELEGNKLSAGLSKCKFFAQNNKFRGMSISQRGLT
jgi:Reverse transcriptase (RNA-dependent DNA polymerase)